MKNQTLKGLLAVTIASTFLSGCMQEEVDYQMLGENLSPSIQEAVDFAFLKKEKRDKAEQSDAKSPDEDDLKLIMFKSIEYPRYAAIVAYYMAERKGDKLDDETVKLLKLTLEELEDDLFLKAFYQSIKDSAGYTSEVIPLNIPNRYGYRVRNSFDMVVPVDSYFAENFPKNGQIVLNKELVPYPECKEQFRPFLLYTPLYEVGDDEVEPFEITVSNEIKGWRVSFEGFRAMIDLACVPEESESSNMISELIDE